MDFARTLAHRLAIPAGTLPFLDNASLELSLSDNLDCH